ncbi:MAG: ABC transporter permease [Phycisphaeraceae bacterium]|nr:ABC transporter permease [Phycisphaeraceae bacterium]
MLAAMTLWQREMVRFVRSPFRVIGALGTPLLFWFMLGSGADQVFSPPITASGGEAASAAGSTAQVGYLQYFFPGAVVMILLFTAIFSVIGVIEDRREGFLQGVLASPAPRWAIVMGKLLGGATLATGQGLILVALWPLIGPWRGMAALGEVMIAMFIAALGLTGLALALAWPMRSTAGFHSVMNLLLLPMWFLSGAVFPAASTPKWMAALMYVNPLTYANAWISAALIGPHSPAAAGIGMGSAVIVSIIFTAAMIALCTAIANRPTAA